MQEEVILNEASFINMYNRSLDVDKLNCGRVLIIAGSDMLSYPAYLNVMAALRSGAGWVVLVAPENVISSVQANYTEVKCILLPKFNKIVFFLISLCFKTSFKTSSFVKGSSACSKVLTITSFTWPG